MSAASISGSEEASSQTARSLVITHIPVVAPEMPAGMIRHSLTGTRFDAVAAIAVCQEGILVGLIGIEELLVASDRMPAAELMDSNPPVVYESEDQEIAALKASRSSSRALAVVNDEGAFLGLILPERLLQVLLDEHEEDMARLGGFMHDVSSARTAAEESVARRLLHRLPWLLIGLVGAFLVAGIISAFEAQLAEHVTLLFFIPSVVYLADAVGTQTETIVIRGLSVGVSINRIVRRELLTGLLVGLAISLAFFPVSLLWWGNADVTWVVTLSLMAACSVATVAAMTLPWIFHRFGTDPAFGSGPLATVVQDLLSVSIYLAIAVLIVS